MQIQANTKITLTYLYLCAAEIQISWNGKNLVKKLPNMENNKMKALMNQLVTLDKRHHYEGFRGVVVMGFESSNISLTLIWGFWVWYVVARS